MNTVIFAEYELKRYLAQMGIYPQIVLKVNAAEFDPLKFKNFDASLDDAFRIDVADSRGEICGIMYQKRIAMHM